MAHAALGSIFRLPRRATDLGVSCPPAGVSSNPVAVQPPAFRHHPDMNTGWQGGQHVCLWPFLLTTRELGTLQGTASAESGAEVPPLSPSITATLPWHTAPSGQLTVTKMQHQSTELWMFPTNTPNILCRTSCISPHSFLDHSMMEMIRDKNLNGCGTKLYVSNSHFHQNRSYF